MKQLAKYFLFSALAASSALSACTGIQLPTKEGQFVNGRTVEFEVTIPLSALFIPRGYAFSAHIPSGKGMSYQSKYAVIGMMGFDEVAILDGLNEKGLTVGVFYFSGFAKYAEINSSNQANALSPVDFSNWILTQFATVEEVKEGLGDVVIAPTVFSQWGPEPPPFHYVVYDQKGNSIVIEPLEGKLVTYNNPLGIITNSPTYDWHMTNLRNYINLRAMNSPPLTIDGVEFKPLSMGAGMHGLPGDFTSPSRFVQASAFSSTAIVPDSTEEGTLQLFHVLNQFDIPKGVSRIKDDGTAFDEYTMMTMVKDPKNLKYYYKTYDDQSIRMLDLKEFDLNSKELKSAPTLNKQVIFDMTKALKDSAQKIAK